jgi:hypothetical protein
MRRAVRAATLAATCAVVAACGTAPREPIPITPSREVATAPVARVAVPPAPAAPAQKVDPSSFPAGAIYVCSSGSGAERKTTAIAFDEKAGTMCRRHPEMGPCQYERDLCRKSGGRVYAPDGTEITLATEAEYDRKVMRVRFKAN